MAQAATWTTTYRVPDWVPNDTEESIVGTLWHQTAISALVEMLEEAARRHGAARGVCAQIALKGLRHDDGTDYDPRPDVVVLPHPLPSGDISSVHLHDAGVPPFIAEVASDSTMGNDVGEKRHAYAAIGVPEYLVFDPNGAVMSTPLLAWRLQSGGYVPWKPDAGGWWQSISLGVTFQATQPILSLRDRDGRQIEVARHVRQRAERLEQRVADLEDQLRQVGALPHPDAPPPETSAT